MVKSLIKNIIKNSSYNVLELSFLSLKLICIKIDIFNFFLKYSTFNIYVTLIIIVTLLLY